MVSEGDVLWWMWVWVVGDPVCSRWVGTGLVVMDDGSQGSGFLRDRNLGFWKGK